MTDASLASAKVMTGEGIAHQAATPEPEVTVFP
jgi:hypothetical protein